MAVHSSRTLRRRFLAVAATVSMVAAYGVVTPTASLAQDAGSGVVTVAYNTPPQTFDPIQSLNSTVDGLLIPAYDTLVALAPGAGTVHPEVATEWEISDDGLTYTFSLRDDVTFHDGAPLTAADVQYTLDRIKTLGIGVASEILDYESSEVIDDQTIALTLAKPYAPFLNALNRVYILNSELVKQNEGDDNAQGWLANNGAGSGRYVLTQLQPDTIAAFEAYPGYWKGWDEPHANQVVFRYIPDAGTQRVLLESGEIDIATAISKDDLPDFLDRDGFKVDVADTLVQFYFWFNMVNGPTTDPLVRQAIAAAYDYDTHSEFILLGYGSNGIGPLPHPMSCHKADVTQPAFDLARAEALLAEAGYGPDNPLEVSISYLPVQDEFQLGFELMQSNLSQIGVMVNPVPVTFPEYAEMARSADTIPDIGTLWVFPTSPDPNAVMFINFHSGNAGTGFNWGHYSNAEVDELVIAAQQTSDEAERCSLYEQAQELVASDYATVNGSVQQFPTVMRDAVEGYQYNGAHHLTVNVNTIWLDE